MLPVALIDLHCDTLVDWDYTTTGNPDTLDDPQRTLSLSAIPKGVNWAQCYAIFIPDEIRNQDAIDYFDVNSKNFHRQMALFSDRVAPCRTHADIASAWAQGKCAGILTVENGSALAGKLERVEILAAAGVRMMTLVWNGENEIGSGHISQKGLTDFGRQAIPLMEQAGILVDVSHLNDTGFYDLLDIAKKPFLATHSNARAVAGHMRNLTDDMIRIMVERNCLIGLNYCQRFIRDDGIVTDFGDLYCHIEHFFNLGAKKCLALGSDFDGTKLPECLNTPTKVAGLLDYFISRGMSQSDAEGILFGNAQRFFEENLCTK